MLFFSFLHIKVTAQDPFQYSDAFEANFAEAGLCRGFQSRERRFYNLLPDASLCLFPFLTRSFAVLHSTFQTLKHRQVRDLTQKTFHHDMYSRNFNYTWLLDYCIWVSYVSNLNLIKILYMFLLYSCHQDIFCLGIWVSRNQAWVRLGCHWANCFHASPPSCLLMNPGHGSHHQASKHHKIHAYLSPCPGWRSPGAFARPKPSRIFFLNSTDP